MHARVGGLCVHMCMYAQFSTTSLSSCSAREGNRKRLLVLCDCVSAVLLGVAGCVCVCMLNYGMWVCYWELLLSLTVLGNRDVGTEVCHPQTYQASDIRIS